MGTFWAGMGTLGEQLGLGRQINLRNQQIQQQTDLQKQAQQLGMLNYGLELQRLQEAQQEFQSTQDPVGHLNQIRQAHGYPPLTEEQVNEMMLPPQAKPESIVQQLGQLYSDPQKFQQAWDKFQQMLYAPDQNGKPPSPQLVEIRARAAGIQGAITPPSAQWKKVPNPDSSTGMSWQDQTTMQMGGEAPNDERDKEQLERIRAESRMQQIETQGANRLRIAELNAKSKGSAQIDKAIHENGDWQHAQRDMLQYTADAHRIWLKMQNPKPGTAWSPQEIADFEQQMQQANDQANEKAQLMNSIGDQIAASMSGQAPPNPQGGAGADNQTGAIPGVQWPSFMGPQTGGKSRVLPGGIPVPPDVTIIRGPK